MKLISHEGRPIVNLGKVECVDLSHMEIHSLITFDFGNKSNVVWSFKDRDKATEIYQCIISNYSEAV